MYLAAVVEAVKQSKNGRYFGLYYSGSTMIETGDMAVYDDDDHQKVTWISFADIMCVLEAEGYFGYLWMSLDGSMTGKWVE